MLSAWWMLAVLMTLYVLSMLDRYIITMLVAPIKADLKLSDFEMSLILGPAFAVFFSLGGLPLGWAADRYPRRWIVFGGVILWGFATMISGFARSFMALFLARMGVGIGEAALNPSVYSLLADKFPRSRLTTAIAIYQSGAKIGAAAAFGLGGAAIALATAIGPNLPFLHGAQPWHLVMIMVGAPGLVLAFLVFTVSEPPRRGKATAVKPVSNRELLFGFLSDNKLLMVLMMVGFALIALVSNAIIAWVPTYIERRFAWTPPQYGPALSLVSLAGAAALVAKGGIMDWLYSRGMKDAHIRFYTWLLAASAPIAWIMFFVPNPWVFLVLNGLLNVVAVAYMVYVSATLSLIAPNELRGQLAAIFLAALVTIGLGLGPMIVGAITTFVLRDDNAIGTSLAITVGGAITLSFILLRFALKPVNAALRRMEALEKAAAEAA
ncbi:MAG: permease of the major facilitator superfamily [Caulobacteraceae bacterium]|nr:permease of the major facilitator superfamily [Caulobacteraceae bacterium]